MLTSKIDIAVNRMDKDQILGYMVWTDTSIPVLHYIYVKKPFRKMGIANLLAKELKEKESVYHTYESTVAKGYDNLIFNPYIRFSL